jgi:LacI family repressor for deo operon, udp, cdd, tsx, nupC, and nupG
MTSIHDVARVTGVSTATVSRALRGLPNVSQHTREAVQRAADELGYVASSSASGLASGHTFAMGVVVPMVGRWFYGSVLEGIDSELRAASYDLILFNLGGHGGDRERVFHRSILRKRTDALITLCIDFTPEEREQLASVGHPSIIVGGPVRGFRHIGIDERGAARLALEHLIALGHRDIAHIGGDDEDGFNTSVPLERRRGYLQALAEAGITPREDWMVDGRFTVSESRSAMAEILARPGPRPSAVFAASDEMAMGAMLAARDAGMCVPRDLSVIGIDDHEFSESFRLTTVAQDPFAQGALAARMLLAELAGGRPRTRSVYLPVQLIDRGSTAPFGG